MLAPTLAAVGVEWVVLNRCFTAELGRSPGRQAVSAVLPATLAGFLAGSLFGVSPVWIAAAVTVASGPAALPAALIGVNVGPNLTYAGSLASLLWRRLLRAQDTDVKLGQFLRLGAVTVPAALAASTLMLWSGVKFGL
jgi:arsenical pump membrane protein